MSNTAHHLPPGADNTLPTGKLFSFAEESCFLPDETPRPERRPVMFRVFSVGRALGRKVFLDFEANYGIYYTDESALAALLCEHVPGYDWTRVVYHRWHDQSRVQMLDPDTGKLIAQLETRRYEGRKVRPEAIESGEYGANVTTIGQIRKLAEARAVAEMEAAAARELAAAQQQADAEHHE